MILSSVKQFFGFHKLFFQKYLEQMNSQNYISLFKQVLHESKFYINILNYKNLQKNTPTQLLQMQKQKVTYHHIQQFISKTKSLLQEEQQLQKEMFMEMTSRKKIHEIQEEGAGLSNMKIISSKDGFYGKTIMTLVKAYSSEKNKVEIPQHCKLQVGDNVAVQKNSTIICDGIVYKRTSEKIKISIRQEEAENDEDLQGAKVNIILKWNQVTFRRYSKILKKLENPDRDSAFFQFLFPNPRVIPKNTGYELVHYPSLNQKQEEAVAKSLSQKCHLIHGPPGTGKTTTVCSLILAAVQKGWKVLACAPSNVAVDNIVEGISRKTNCIRIGNPARVTEDVLEHCLDFVIGKSDGLWQSEMKKLNSTKKKLGRAQNKAQKRELWGEIKQLRSQIGESQKQRIGEILNDANVLCSTNVGADDQVFRKYLSDKIFDLVVIDQCGQGLEVSCWIPLLKGRRLVLAGDHKQLPPTVKFQTNSSLSYTLFSRVIEQLPHISSTMLQIQYRMNKLIMGWSNQQFYSNRLKADKSVENHVLHDIYNKVDESDGVLLHVDTCGCQIGEQGLQNESKFNKGEADIAIQLYRKFLESDVTPKHIAILTPYSKQVTLLKNLLNQENLPPVEVSTIDGIQGREKECIIISLVRSNPEHTIGFLKDWRRMNVAVTRAKRMLIIIGDSESMQADPVLKHLASWIEEKGIVKSAMQFSENPKIRFGLGRIQKEKKQKENNDCKKQTGKQRKKAKIQEKKKKQTINDKRSNDQVNKNYFLSQDEDVEIHNKYKSLLDKLPAEGIVFENLDGFQRKIVHQIAEQFGYFHQTSANKKNLTVKFKEVKQEQVVVKSQLQDKTTELKEKTENKEKKQNKERVKNSKKTEVEVKQTEAQKSQKNIKKKKKEKKEMKDKVEQQQEDWEKILDEFEEQMGKGKDKCYQCEKKITSVTSTICKYCRRYFCRRHVLAEEHGCDEPAREEAKKNSIYKVVNDGALKVKEKIQEQQSKRRKKQSKK